MGTEQDSGGRPMDQLKTVAEIMKSLQRIVQRFSQSIALVAVLFLAFIVMALWQSKPDVWHTATIGGFVFAACLLGFLGPPVSEWLRIRLTKK